jgi:hypothetical protein
MIHLDNYNKTNTIKEITITYKPKELQPQDIHTILDYVIDALNAQEGISFGEGSKDND